MKIGIGYAAYITNDRLMEFARGTLNSMVSQEHELVFHASVTKYTDDLYPEGLSEWGDVGIMPENNVSMGWNRAIGRLIEKGCDYVIVPNLDVVAKSNCIDNLVAYAESNRDTILVWTATQWNDPDIEAATEEPGHNPHPHFSFFMVDNRLFEEVGEFDENFRPAYNEDLDMHWRIRLAGYDAVGVLSARFFHHGSRAIAEDELLGRQNNVTHAANDAYFRAKWGYKPPTANDPFTTGMYRWPFNRPPNRMTGIR